MRTKTNLGLNFVEGTLGEFKICTQTFFGQYKPLSEKTGTNSNRIGNFLFCCDNCITRLEKERAASSSDKFTTMQSQIDKLDSNMAEIKQILLGTTDNAGKEKRSVTPTVQNAAASNNERWKNPQKYSYGELIAVKRHPNYAIRTCASET